MCACAVRDEDNYWWDMDQPHFRSDGWVEARSVCVKRQLAESNSNHAGRTSEGVMCGTGGGGPTQLLA